VRKSSDQNKNNPFRNQSNIIKVKTKPVGKLLSVQVGHYPRQGVPFAMMGRDSRDNAWYCEKIEVRDNQAHVE